MSSVKYFTEEGLERLRAELHNLKTVERQNMAAQIAEAREKGDLSENAEYDAAKEAQGHLEARIASLENDLANGRVMDESMIDDSKAYILSTVRVLNKKFKKEFNYTLVTKNEADLKAGRISVESPIGKAILGSEVGDVVEAKVPNGIIEFEILEISRS